MPISPEHELFGRALRELREAKELSQAQLAELAGLPESYVSACEDGEVDLDLHIMLALSEALGEGPSEIIFRYEILRRKDAADPPWDDDWRAPR
jgi:transcriptional regulator with XRE-family HTH domain